MLKLQNYGHLMQRADSLEKTLMLGKTEGKRRKVGRAKKFLLNGDISSSKSSLCHRDTADNLISPCMFCFNDGHTTLMKSHYASKMHLKEPGMRGVGPQ